MRASHEKKDRLLASIDKSGPFITQGMDDLSSVRVPLKDTLVKSSLEELGTLSVKSIGYKEYKGCGL